jgi:hypothetical protein
MTTLVRPAVSQTDSCANPNAPRIGLIAEDAFTDAASSPQSDARMKSIVNAEIKFRDQLARRMPTGACIVTSHNIFNDAKNYPQLKGSPIIEIRGDASTKNTGVFALAVTISSTQGVYAQDQLRLFTLPLLIESESDYTFKSEGFMVAWGAWWSASPTHLEKK